MFYAVEWDGRPFEVFLGYENDYVNGEKTDIRGYEAVDALDMSHGGFRSSVGEGLMPRAEPSTYHYPWTLEGDRPCLRGSDLTLDDAMRLWRVTSRRCSRVKRLRFSRRPLLCAARRSAMGRSKERHISETAISS